MNEIHTDSRLREVLAPPWARDPYGEPRRVVEDIIELQYRFIDNIYSTLISDINNNVLMSVHTHDCPSNE